MLNANINAKELTAMKDKDFLYTKALVIDKIKLLFSGFEPSYRKILQSEILPEDASLLEIPGKVSRGENYRLLPYVILDYPRYFQREATFAVRTMFWWGNFFSFTLHIGGTMMSKYKNAVAVNISELGGRDYFICVADAPWEHHYEADNYCLIDNADIESCLEKDFLKISYKTDLEKVTIVQDQGEKCITDFASLLRSR